MRACRPQCRRKYLAIYVRAYGALDKSVAKKGSCIHAGQVEIMAGTAPETNARFVHVRLFKRAQTNAAGSIFRDPGNIDFHPLGHVLET